LRLETPSTSQNSFNPGLSLTVLTNRIPKGLNQLKATHRTDQITETVAWIKSAAHEVAKVGDIDGNVCLKGSLRTRI
jgi:hypothetical protein